MTSPGSQSTHSWQAAALTSQPYYRRQGEDLRTSEAPGRQLRQLWNADPDLDLRCMEAVKLHMLAEAVQLERDQERTDRVRIQRT